MALRLKKKKQEEAGVEEAQSKEEAEGQEYRWDWKALVKIFRLYYNWEMKSMQSFEQESDVIWLKF